MSKAFIAGVRLGMKAADTMKGINSVANIKLKATPKSSTIIGQIATRAFLVTETAANQ
jgi:hypothetical protein